jgi:DNA-binding CsgD family transcriptional regulator
MADAAVRHAPTERGLVLQAVGVSLVGERVYATLLDNPRASEVDVAALLQMPEREVVAAVRELETLGLLSRLADTARTIVPAPPAIAIEALALRRRQEIDEALLAASHYATAHAARHLVDQASGADVVEVITGHEAVTAHFAQSQLAARRTMRVFDTPPYIAVADDAPNQAEFDILARGVECRVIYDEEALDAPHALDLIRRAAAAGERSRLAPALPTKLVIVDDDMALLPLHPSGSGGSDAVMLVHRSPLLTALVALFEAFWLQSRPLNLDPLAQGEDAALPLPRDGQHLLALIAAGKTTASIARQLGISPRSVRRRVERLRVELGARNRMELVTRAAERGLL